MPETDPNSFAAPQVQDKRTKPPGVLPKNIQAWIICGLALLMVIVFALSGKNPPKGKGVSATPQESVTDPNAERIQEYQARIDEQTRKLREEQAQLTRTQQVLGMPAGVPATAGAPATYLQAGYPRGAEPAVVGPNTEDSIQQDKRKREYQSLFASNVALSYRKEPANTAGPESVLPVSAAMQPRALPSFGYPMPPELPTAAAPALPKANTAREQKADEQANSRESEQAGDQARPKRETDAELQRAEGKQYRLFEGTVLETVLTNRLDGYFSGPVNCMVTTNVYSHDGQRLLIPQGSRILGEVKRVETFGQQRLAVFFHRLIMPDGYSLSLDKFQGLSQIGETGLVDQINHHYIQIFGVSLAIGAIAGLSQANTQYGLNESAADAYRQGVTTSLSQSSMQILDKYLNVLPTFTIREGQRVKVYLSNDLLLPAYERHQIPSDL